SDRSCSHLRTKRKLQNIERASKSAGRQVLFNAFNNSARRSIAFSDRRDRQTADMRQLPRMMPPRKLYFVLFLSISSLLLVPSKTAMSSQLYADLVLLDGKIWTVSAAKRELQAVAIRDGRIVAAGSN